MPANWRTARLRTSTRRRVFSACSSAGSSGHGITSVGSACRNMQMSLLFAGRIVKSVTASERLRRFERQKASGSLIGRSCDWADEGDCAGLLRVENRKRLAKRLANSVRNCHNSKYYSFAEALSRMPLKLDSHFRRLNAAFSINRRKLRRPVSHTALKKHG